MKTQPLGRTDLLSTRLVYGNMRVAGGWDPAKVSAQQIESGMAAILAAYDAGYTHFDTADIYCRGVCETIQGKAMKQIASMRQHVLVTTKCGIRFPGDPDADSPHRYDFSARHILWSCEQSLRRLDIDVIDVYLLHRPDVLMNPHEVAGAFDQLRREGKVRWFGVSNFTPSQVAMLQTHLDRPLAMHQVEIHPGRLDAFTDGTLDQCLQLNITPQAWSPLGRGVFAQGGNVPEKHANPEGAANLLATLDAVAGELGVNRTITTLAWLLKHPSGILPVVGSTTPQRIAEATRADAVEMSRDQWYRIYLAARMRPLP